MLKVYQMFPVDNANKARWEDIWSISECPDLVEVTLDGNPLCNSLNYRQSVVVSSPKLKMLDGKRITVCYFIRNIFGQKLISSTSVRN